MATSRNADIFIIGGGPAGLSAALALAPQNYSIVVFDSGSYRNARNTRLYYVPGWDNKAPEDYRKATREELSQYPNIRLVDLEITYVVRTREDRFLIMDGINIMWTGRKMILATGTEDVLPDIDGYEKLWALTIFDNFIYRTLEEGEEGRTCGILAVDLCADPAIAVRLSKHAALVTSSVTFYTNGEEGLDEQIAAASGDGKKPKIDTRKIEYLKKSYRGPQVIVVFEDGSRAHESFLVHTPITQPKGTLAGQLHLDLSPEGEVKAEAPFYQTSMRGVFAAGDCVTPYKTTTRAIASGCSVGLAVAEQLQAEDAGYDSIV